MGYRAVPPRPIPEPLGPGTSRPTLTRQATSSTRVVDRGRAGYADGEGQTAQWGVGRGRPDAVGRVRGRVDQVSLSHDTFLGADLHDPSPRQDVIELVGR